MAPWNRKRQKGNNYTHDNEAPRKDIVLQGFILDKPPVIILPKASESTTELVSTPVDLKDIIMEPASDDGAFELDLGTAPKDLMGEI